MMAPTAATVLVAEPVMEANTAQARMVVIPMPPYRRPTSERTTLMI